MARLVFLGGTAGNNAWREGFIERLINRGVGKECLFNPVVTDWNDEARIKEEAAKRDATHHLYYIASPKQDGNPLSAYSMVEATVALAKHPKNTVVVFDHEGMDGHAAKAMKQAEKVLRTEFPKGNIFGAPKEAEDWLTRELTKGVLGRLFAA